MGLRTIGIRSIGLRKPVVSGIPYWTQHLFGEVDLNLRAVGRVGLTMPDTIGANDITIITPTYGGLAGSNLNKPTGVLEKWFDGNSYTLYFKFKQLNTLGGGQRLYDGGNGLAVARGLVFFTGAPELTFLASDGVMYSQTNIVANLNTTILGNGWFEMFVEVDFSAKRLRCTIYKVSDGSSVGTAVNANISTWAFNSDDNAAEIIFGGIDFAMADFKKFLGLKTITQCRDNNYVTNIQINYPTIVDGTDVGGNGNHLIRSLITRSNLYYDIISTYCLDYGYSLYRSRNRELGAGYEDVYIPNSPTGVAISRTFNDVGGNVYIKLEDHAGSLTEHNLAETRLNIPIAQWDKSSAIIFANSVRSSAHYLAGNPDEWHISELDYLSFSQQCNTNYKGLNFFKVDGNSLGKRNILKEIFSYSTNNTVNDIQKIIQYTGDKKALSDSILLNCDANIVSSISFGLRAIIGTNGSRLYWGDGTYIDIFPHATLIQTRTKTYGDTNVYPIYIVNPENLDYFYDSMDVSHEVAPLSADIGEFNKASNITSLTLYGNKTPWTGVITGLSKKITNLWLTEHKGVGGDITGFINLVNAYLDFAGYGDMSGAVNFETGYLEGNNTIHIDITNMPNIRQLDNQFGGYSLLSGDVTNKLNFRILCWAMPCTLYGDASNCPIEYWATSGDDRIIITANINGWVNCYLINNTAKNVAFSGSLSNLPLLQFYASLGDQSTIIRPTTVANNPKLCMFVSDKWNFTSEEQNQILADIRANKDVARTEVLRNINLTAGTPVNKPTGQGLIDAAYLRTYRSPNNDAGNALWTISINE